MEWYKLLSRVSRTQKANCEIVTALLNAAGNKFSSNIVNMHTPSQLKHFYGEKNPNTKLYSSHIAYEDLENVSKPSEFCLNCEVCG